MLRAKKAGSDMYELFWNGELVDIVGGYDWDKDDIKKVVKEVREDCIKLEKKGIKPTILEITKIL